MSDQSRRRVLKSIAAGGVVVLAGGSLPEHWFKPVVKAVVLPAHAQTSPCGEVSFIRVTSPLTENNNIQRAIAIFDDSGNPLAACCCGEQEDLIIEADSLGSGVYRVVGGSEVPLDQIVFITTECGTVSVTAPTDETCNFLMATVTLPEGSVEQESGQQGLDACDAGELNCLQGAESP